MIRLPIWMWFFIPKKWEGRQIQMRWDDKSDSEIAEAYRDAIEWININNGALFDGALDDIADECKCRLDKYILPQMKNRPLLAKGLK